MWSVDLFTLIVILSFGALLAYRSQFFRSKTIGKFRLFDVLYMVIIPGFLFVLGFSYLQSILQRPRSEFAFLPDGLLVNVILVSMLFTYGGIAIHSVAKRLSAEIGKKQSAVYELNRYFHMQFSHNLVYSGAVLILVGFSLLELNHPLADLQENLLLSVMKGLVLGGSFVLGMYIYTVDDDDYGGNWADLKAVFFLSWIALVLLIYSMRRVNSTIHEHQLLIPSLLFFALINGIFMYLAWRRYKEKPKNAYEKLKFYISNFFKKY